MSVDLGRATIFKEFEALRIKWNETESIWKDVVREEFTKEKWMPLDAAVLTCLSALDRLAPVLVQVREDCSNRGSGYM